GGRAVRAGHRRVPGAQVDAGGAPRARGRADGDARSGLGDRARGRGAHRPFRRVAARPHGVRRPPRGRDRLLPLPAAVRARGRGGAPARGGGPLLLHHGPARGGRHRRLPLRAGGLPPRRRGGRLSSRRAVARGPRRRGRPRLPQRAGALRRPVSVAARRARDLALVLALALGFAAAAMWSGPLVGESVFGDGREWYGGGAGAPTRVVAALSWRLASALGASYA